MDEILKWIMANKEWVFSGVGVPIALGLIRYLLKVIESHNHREVVPSKVEHSVENAVAFYSVCAESYDDRNTNYLFETHHKICSEIRSVITEGKMHRILDLGGGTGKVIALSFSDSEKVEWTNYDLSDRMLRVYESHLRDAAMSTVSIRGDISAFEPSKFKSHYDVAILCFVLSSMKSLPDFLKIAEVIVDGGTLIISDGDPIYTLKKGGQFKISMHTQTQVLNLNPHNPVKIIENVCQAGFVLKSSSVINKGIDNINQDYSYILCFQKIIKS
ncbi:class I SAM-dependent methyltransferase [Oleiphilus messinensis]|nr:class I SAM-dependent methyltransferase [Oleiphilus messinensis]